MLRAWFDAERTAEYPREINVATEHPGAPMGYVMLDRGNTNGGVYHYQSGVAGDRPARDEIEWWGMPPIVYTLERVARKWADDGHPRIQIGDMTRPQGGTYWRLTDEEYVDDGREDYVRGNHVEATSPKHLQEKRPDGVSYRKDHSSHRRGWVVDIRPMISSEKDIGSGLTTRSDRYDQEKSYSFLESVNAEAPVSNGNSMLSTVLFGDSDFGDDEEMHLDFVIVRSNHDDHYHITVPLVLKA